MASLALITATESRGDSALQALENKTFNNPVYQNPILPGFNPGPNQERGEAVHVCPDLPAHPWPTVAPCDNFDETTLALDWNFLRTPRTTWWDLASKPGFLQLQLRPEVLSDKVNPSFLALRQKDLNFEASTRMLFRPEARGEAAGMTVYRKSTAHFTFLHTLHNGKPALVVTARSMNGETIVEDVLASVPVNSNDLHLKITGNNIFYDFSYSLDGQTWNTLKEKAWGGILDQFSFTGAHVGIYATGSNTNRIAAFDWFEYQPTATKVVREN